MKRTTILFVIFTFFILLGVFWWINGTSAVNNENRNEKIFVVRPGDSIRDIANRLKKEGLIKDPIVFFLLVKQLGLDGKIQAGSFRLSPSLNATDIAQNLTHGTLDIWITVPEGKRAEEVLAILKEKIPTYQNSWEQDFTAHEGYLFPDTYLIPVNADSNLIITIMRNTFDQKYKELEPLVEKSSLSKDEIVTLASLIEREAKLEEDRTLVSSVIHNRLDIGMKLDIDATVQYILGYQADEKTWWKRHLTFDDLSINSPFNTYRNAGLPPKPIANPGLAALKAVVNPTQTNYLYYISDKTGKNHYAQTLEQHEANKEKFGL
ncbi:MAG: endolytic transglycosylase MltG [Candidatus Levybacteria bacterium]|nr:endolytic transglycosylase MltG [Candidatus Levybacteria bacterium]